MNNQLDNFLSLVSDNQSGWIEKANYRQQNQDWLDFSAEIAIKVLRTLRAKGISQKDLADKMEVSPQYINKIVKGTENLSIETIYKLQNALGIILIQMPNEMVLEESVWIDVIMHPSTKTYQDTIDFSTEEYVISEVDDDKNVA